MVAITHLLMTAAEADALLNNQMLRGADLQDVGMSDQELDQRIEQIDAWDVETRDLLLSMFDTPEMADKFTGSASMYTKGTTLMDKLTYIGQRMTYKNYALDEIRKRLPFYSEQVPEKGQASFWDLMHPTIVGLSRKKFEDGHQADAVETAFKHINETVKRIVVKRGGTENDGASLMQSAFSLKNPIISLDDLSTENGKNIQLGYMQIFAGSMTGIRNPKAHSVLTIDDNRAIHLLFLASLLMQKIDEAL